MVVRVTEKPNLKTNQAILKSREATYALWQELQTDLYAKYPKPFKAACDEILSGKQKDVVIYGYKSHLTHNIDQVLELICAFPDQLRAVCMVVESDTECTLSEYKGLKIVHQQDFLNDIVAYKGALLVDLTIVWKPFSKFANHFSRAGLIYVRIEQFRLAPFITTGSIESYRRDYYIEHLEDLIALESIYEDDKSVLVYHTALQSIMSSNTIYYLSYNDNHAFLYIPEDVDFSFGSNEVFIDTGAYDGSDAINFAKKVNYRFDAIHSFEPERNNFLLTSNRIHDFINSLPADASRDFYIHPLGVWDKKEIVSILGEARGVIVQDILSEYCYTPSQNNIFVTDLDTYIDRLTYLKLEIEGAELQALRGAEKLIKDLKPKLAVAVYHLADDFFTLSSFISNLDVGYTFRLRHHGLDCGSLNFYCQVKE